MSALQKLMFAIGVSDQGSAKVLGFQKAIDRTCRSVRQDFEGIKAGALSAAGAGMSLYQMVNPAVDFNRAVGEVRSLGTAEDALAYLQTSAKQFAVQYGGSAAEVVRSSYDIQSAISGLNGKDLGTFTVASATLAKGVKADAATITDYMGTMYGVWEKQATQMGKSQWVEQMVGKTAFAVQMFKTNGNKWAEGLSALGASATAKGIGMDEQFAILGNLQMTMSGSEAATKYNAFLAGVGSAQKELGLKFTDKSGNMLGMDTILEKIKGKFGDSLSVNESGQLKKAFGSDEAVKLIELLMGKTGKLRQDMRAIGRINNMDHAKTMAKSMTDIWARLGGAWDVLRITFAQRMLPAIEKVTDKIVGFIHYIQKCMDIAPGLTGKLGIIVAGAIALAGVMGVLGLVVSANKLAFLGLTTIGGPVITVFKMIGMAIRANPIGFLIWSLAMCILYWTDVRAAIGAVWDKLLGFLGGLGPIGQGLVAFFQKIAQWWNDLTTALTNGQWTKAFMQILDAIMAPLRALGDGIGWVGEKLGIISGEAPKIEASGVAALAAPRQARPLPGGVAGQISNATNNSGKTVTIGSITVQPQTMPSLDEMEEQGWIS